MSFTVHPRPSWPSRARSIDQQLAEEASGSALVSIILLNWNQLAVTAACLETLCNVTWPNVEVIVVDQDSDHGESERLKRAFPNVIVLDAGQNLGFTGGNNLAMRHAKGEYILLLNNDTEVPPSFLEPLVHVLESNPSVGVVSPKIRYFDDPDRIQYAGCDAISDWTMRGHTTGYGEVDNGQHDQGREVALAHGAAMMIRRNVIERIGMLAEDFFIYYEEFDFCSRARKDGWSIRYVPESLVMHKESVTVGKKSPLKSGFMARNRITYLRRNLNGMRKAVALTYVLGLAIPVEIARHVVARRWVHLGHVFRGVSWHLRHPDVSGNSYFFAEDTLPEESASSVDVHANDHQWSTWGVSA